MPEHFTEDLPRIVSAKEGFSVVYKGRYLYSQYKPERAILNEIESLHVLPATLFLCLSPCLCYGLAELQSKVSKDCLLVGCEIERALYKLASEHFKKSDNTVLLTPKETAMLPELLQKRGAVLSSGFSLPYQGCFRRCAVISFSAGVFFNRQFYDALASAVQNTLSQFWKNRLTLIQFGHLYSRNLFRNIPLLPESIELSSIAHTITKPVVVLGAGESMESAAISIKKYRNQLYVLAVDAALPSVLQFGVKPDAIVGMECQIAIEKAYIGSKGCNILLFADISSRPSVPRITGGDVCFFTSLYDDNDFLKKICGEKIIPAAIPPLGSVGLAAVQIALFLRRADSVPVFIAGLDFSYTEGITHSRGTPSHTQHLITSNRLHPIPDYRSAFSSGTRCVSIRHGAKIITSKNLESYAKTFKGFFGSVPNLYNAGDNTLLEINTANLSEFLQFNGNKESICGKKPSLFGKKDNIIKFLLSEQNALHEIKDILSQGHGYSKADVDKKIYKLLTAREYLYLHFPDGINISTNISFLKRVRSEIDFFEKDIKLALAILAKNGKEC